MPSPIRYRADELVRFATALLDKAGLESDKSKVVAQILVEGDLLGHNTHGLHLLAPYLNDLEKGGMTRSGSPRVIADFPAAVTWDGMRLPGETSLRRREKQLKEGVELYPSIMPALCPWSEKLRVAAPIAVG